MSHSHLGPQFDIHCGGEDHLAIHHVNEIAQSEACYGTRLARFWMHGRFLVLDDERMSKSSGSFLTLDSLVEAGYDPLAYRMFLLGAHYRRPLSFNWEALDAATAAWNGCAAAPTPGVLPATRTRAPSRPSQAARTATSTCPGPWPWSGTWCGRSFPTT